MDKAEFENVARGKEIKDGRNRKEFLFKLK